MKWKKIGDILIIDDNFDFGSYLDNGCDDDFSSDGNQLSDSVFEKIAKNHNVRSIIRIEKIDGEKREPTVDLLYGNDTNTVHKENGCLFNLDLSKVMWAKGNNNERLRIAKLVGSGETVVDMFAGIGYFSIPIGVHSDAKQIYSIEINPNSYRFLKNNIELNKINKKAGYDRMVPILGDCREEAPKYSADRVLMGYVKTTHHYLKPAMECVRDGGIIHYHETVPLKLIETRPYERVKKAAWQCGEREVEVLNIQHIKRYAPGVEHIVLDARIY